MQGGKQVKKGDKATGILSMWHPRCTLGELRLVGTMHITWANGTTDIEKNWPYTYKYSGTVIPTPGTVTIKRLQENANTRKYCNCKSPCEIP